MNLKYLIGPKYFAKRISVSPFHPSGILLTDSAREKPSIAIITAVGRYPNGQPLPLQIGDHIIVPKFHDRTVTIEGEEYLVLEHHEPLAKVEE